MKSEDETRIEIAKVLKAIGGSPEIYMMARKLSRMRDEIHFLNRMVGGLEGRRAFLEGKLISALGEKAACGNWFKAHLILDAIEEELFAHEDDRRMKAWQYIKDEYCKEEKK